MDDRLKNIFWLGHASFKIKDEVSGNIIYYIDPFDFKLSQYNKADIIFITHAHYDHCSRDDINKIIKPNTTLIAATNCFANLSLSAEYQKQEVVPNQSYALKGVPFKTIPAYNVVPERLTFHPKSNNWVGYIITVNGQKIYHAGDTDFIPEMKTLGPIDIAMLPVGGTYTMDVSEAIEAANTIAAQITTPMHYKRLLGKQAKQAEEKLKAGVTKSKVVILQEVG